MRKPTKAPGANPSASTKTLEFTPERKPILRSDDNHSGSSNWRGILSAVRRRFVWQGVWQLLHRLMVSDEGTLSDKVLRLFPCYRRTLVKARNERMNGGFY